MRGLLHSRANPISRETGSVRRRVRLTIYNPNHLETKIRKREVPSSSKEHEATDIFKYQDHDIGSIRVFNIENCQMRICFVSYCVYNHDACFIA